MIDHLDRCPDDVKIPKRRAQLHTLTFTASNRYRDRRHLNESDLPCVQNPEVKDMHWTRKKVVIDDDKKIPISLFRSSEYNLEKVITSKQRIVSSEQKRNYIPVASEGDKPFKVAELSPNFFQSGGLIPGSTIQPRPVKQLKGSKASNETLTKSIKSMTATEKRLQYINESDKTQVEMLNVSIFFIITLSLHYFITLFLSYYTNYSFFIFVEYSF